MRRIAVILLSLLLALGLLGGGAWFWLNHYIHSPAFATQVKQEASRLTGVPVTFKDIVWELGRGITLTGLDMRHGEKSPELGQFKTEQIILKYDWQSLLARRFEITRLTIKQPSVLIGQDAAGNYVLPVVIASKPEDKPATATASASESSSSPITLAWQSFNLEKGTVEVKSNDGSTRLLLSGIETEARSVAGDKPGLKGSITIGEIWLMQKLKVTSARSPMVLEGDTFSLGSIEADAYGGHVSGSWQQNFSDPKKAYELKLNLSDCDVNALLSGVAQKTGMLSGRLDAKTFWLGPATDPVAVSGKGTIEIRNGQLIQIPFFKTLSQMLGVAALSQPDFAQCKLEFTVADQVISITAFELKSALFVLNGKGTVGFDSVVKMDCRLDLSPDLSQQLPSAMEKALDKRDDGYRSVPFKLGGTIDSPKVELVLTQTMVDQAVDALKGLFGKKEKKVEAPAPAPAPAAETPVTTPATPAADTTAPAAVPSTNAPTSAAP